MSILSSERLVIESDGASDVLALNQVNYKVFVKYGAGASGTLTFLMGNRESDMIPTSTPDQAGALQTTTTADKVFEMSGGGFLGVSAASVVGQITIEMVELLP